MLTSQQIAARQNGVGASEAAIPLGLGRITETELFYQKACGLAGREYPDELAWLGNEIEAPIVAHYTRETGHKVRRVRGTVRHPERPETLGNPDRLAVGVRRGLECKWRMRTDGFGAAGSDHVPDEILIQCAQYLALYPRRECWDVHVMFSRGEFRTYTIGRDRNLIDTILESNARFWRYVVSARGFPEAERAAKATPPPVDHSHATAGEILALMYPEHDGRELVVGEDVPADLQVARDAYHFAAEREKRARAMKLAARAEILDAMESASTLRFPDGARFVRRRTYAAEWRATRPDGHRLIYQRPKTTEAI